MKFKSQKDSIGYLLIQISKLRRNQSNLLLAQSGIHAGQDALLFYLDMQDGQTITALVEKLQVQYATISNMISRMEAAGLITREKDKADKRTSRIYITPKGQTALIKTKETWQAMETKTSAGLTGVEQEMLITLLKKVLNNLNTSL